MSIFRRKPGSPFPLDATAKHTLPRSGREAEVRITSESIMAHAKPFGTERVLAQVSLEFCEYDFLDPQDSVKNDLSEALEVCTHALDSEICRAIWKLRRRNQRRKRIRSNQCAV